MQELSSVDPYNLHLIVKICFYLRSIYDSDWNILVFKEI